jgi:hypothetical protein
LGLAVAVDTANLKMQPTGGVGLIIKGCHFKMPVSHASWPFFLWERLSSREDRG